jgi:large subunit ribosomal protein L15
MQIHQLIRITPNKKRMTVARGGKRGKTAGRGTKGQNARSGHKKRPEMRDIIKRIPKLRGRGVNALTSIAARNFPVNIGLLEVAFQNGAVVSPTTLAEKGIITSHSGVLPDVKVLGTGELTKKLSVEGCAVSASAKAAIEKAGGSVKAHVNTQLKG